MSGDDSGALPLGHDLSPADESQSLADGRVDEWIHAMNRERCLHVFSLLVDGRPVPAAVEHAARQFALGDEDCAVALEDYRTLHELLASEPGVQASPGFATRVVAARTDEGAAVLPFVRRLALAAALALAVTVGWALATPQELMADGSLEADVHTVDHFRSSPYQTDDLTGGITSLLTDPDPFDRELVRPAQREAVAGEGADR